ncbi:MAG: hypothetical protein DI616_05670 [Paracoccus denitrificans]|uniref:Uncharacterized protein n=1 Tax=Paracoccus denitrificans TaxID=266 RepID=A0A533IDV6_PARDE|nr:MAG: hypothetical protein DI616_05670 [Paracoccus denitrificans]
MPLVNLPAVTRLRVFCLVVILAPVTALAGDAVVDFASPTGNIYCIFRDVEDVSPSGVHCEIYDFIPSQPDPFDVDCHEPPIDWGAQVDLGSTGMAQPVCSGDPVGEGAMELPYGYTITGEGITCASDTGGVTCTNRDGHGFTLSRSRQVLF